MSLKKYITALAAIVLLAQSHCEFLFYIKGPFLDDKADWMSFHLVRFMRLNLNGEWLEPTRYVRYGQ